jgi:predicted Kef-type K+ transport protein
LNLGSELWPALTLSLFVLIGNPLLVISIMGYMGYRKQTGFLCGLKVAQFCEFSIIFIAMCIALGLGRQGSRLAFGQEKLGAATDLSTPARNGTGRAGGRFS